MPLSRSGAMQANPLDYPRLVQDALRGVVRRSLSYVQTHGLPGEHHFYLAFATGAPGVSLSEDLRRRYPDQITIVIQHDYRDLDVDDEYFAVTLRFGGVPQRIRVPFEAMISFYDPASQFALRFEPEIDDDDAEPAPNLEDTSSRAAVRAVLAAADRLAAAKEAALKELGESQDAEGEEGEEPAMAPPLRGPGPVPATAAAPGEGDGAADDAGDGDGEGGEGEGDEPAPPSDNVVSIESFRRK
ncbi:MAG: ClpXP protease specificity-enhancing factor SspB [Acidobacteriota bacterium]